jgi:hypothetical protein
VSGIGGCRRRNIRLIEGNAKCRQLKKITCKGTLRQGYPRYNPEDNHKKRQIKNRDWNFKELSIISQLTQVHLRLC